MDRKLRILLAVVELYINTGEPVGSKALADMFGNTVSSATIRNDMAALCELGFLEQPHTSAGRVPTVKGYRAYVDSIKNPNPAPQTRRRIDEAVDKLSHSGGSAPEAGRALSELTGLPTLSTSERGCEQIACVKAVSVGSGLWTVIVITAGGRVGHGPLRCGSAVTTRMVDRFTTAATAALGGMRLDEVSAATVQSAAATLGGDMLPMAGFIEALTSAVYQLSFPDVSMSGESSLFSTPGYDLAQLRELLGILNDHSALLRLLRSEPNGVTVFIGGENPAPQLSGSALLTTGYGSEGRTLGRLGVIAPMRINYRSMIPVIDYFSARLSRLLGENPDTEGDNK